MAQVLGAGPALRGHWTVGATGREGLREWSADPGPLANSIETPSRSGRACAKGPGVRGSRQADGKITEEFLATGLKPMWKSLQSYGARPRAPRGTGRRGPRPPRGRSEGAELAAPEKWVLAQWPPLGREVRSLWGCRAWWRSFAAESTPPTPLARFALGMGRNRRYVQAPSPHALGVGASVPRPTWTR